jgi:hypothetical protein
LRLAIYWAVSVNNFGTVLPITFGIFRYARTNDASDFMIRIAWTISCTCQVPAFLDKRQMARGVKYVTAVSCILVITTSFFRSFARNWATIILGLTPRIAIGRIHALHLPLIITWATSGNGSTTDVWFGIKIFKSIGVEWIGFAILLEGLVTYNWTRLTNWNTLVKHARFFRAWCAQGSSTARTSAYVLHTGDRSIDWTAIGIVGISVARLLGPCARTWLQLAPRPIFVFAFVVAIRTWTRILVHNTRIIGVQPFSCCVVDVYVTIHHSRIAIAPIFGTLICGTNWTLFFVRAACSIVFAIGIVRIFAHMLTVWTPHVWLWFW